MFRSFVLLNGNLLKVGRHVYQQNVGFAIGITNDIRSLPEGEYAFFEGNNSFINYPQALADDGYNYGIIHVSANETNNGWKSFVIHANDAAASRIKVYMGYCPQPNGNLLWMDVATKSDLDYLKIKPVYNPEKTGKNTLHEFILSEIARIGCTEISFSVGAFSDLPRQDWGYGCHVQYSGGHYTVFLYMETNNAIYLRTANAHGWENEWVTIARNIDLENKTILTEPPNTEIPDLNTFITLNKRVGTNSSTLNRPDGSASFGAAINIGYAANIFTQVLFDSQYKNIWQRKYVGWETNQWGEWLRIATTSDLAALETRVAALEAK